MSSEEDDHVIEMKMHFELLAVLEELDKAEKVWQDGVDTISRCVFQITIGLKSPDIS
jgi:hypothetical protein